MGRECVITFATITSVDITAHADTVTFSMTTIDPAQVRAREACSSEANQSEGQSILISIATVNSVSQAKYMVVWPFAARHSRYWWR